MSRPAGWHGDWFVGVGVDLAAIRKAAERCAARGYGPTRIHHHAYSADCDGCRHELVGSLEQMRLEGFDLPAGATRATT